MIPGTEMKASREKNTEQTETSSGTLWHQTSVITLRILNDVHDLQYHKWSRDNLGTV